MSTFQEFDDEQKNQPTTGRKNQQKSLDNQIHTYTSPSTNTHFKRTQHNPNACQNPNEIEDSLHFGFVMW